MKLRFRCIMPQFWIVTGKALTPLPELSATKPDSPHKRSHLRALVLYSPAYAGGSAVVVNRVAQFFFVFQRLPGAQCDRVQTFVCDGNRQAGSFSECKVQISQQCSAPGEHYTTIHDI